MQNLLPHLPALLLATEYLFGGLVRISSFPFPSIHDQVNRKNTSIVPILYPIVPFKTVDAHNKWVGAWMMATGVLWAHPATRGSLATLGLSLFWTSAGAYSQRRASMPFWLPIVNFGLSWVAWWVENRSKEDGVRLE